MDSKYMAVSQHYVEFFSPGTFMPEITTKEVASWDVEAATEMAHAITERHGATPFGFRFITRGRAADELDAKRTAMSPMYYLGGKIETLDEIKARNDPKDSILIGNMEGNGYDRVIVNDNSWRFTGPLNERDVVLEWAPRRATGEPGR